MRRRVAAGQSSLFQEPPSQGDPESCSVRGCLGSEPALEPLEPGAPPDPVFIDGETFEEERDGVRLAGQLQAVRDLMADGEWRTLHTIARYVGGSEAGVSARLRDLRKARHGAHTLERKYIAKGIWSYRLHLHRAPGSRA